MLIAFSIMVMGALPVMAQKIAPEKQSDFYVVSIPIEKIYPSRHGYVVVYRKGISQTARAYIPMAWFEESEDGGTRKAELVNIGAGAAWPNMSVYYKEGAFDHVRLYVRREKGHQSWGSLPQNTDLESEFSNTDTLTIQY
jgi:hypothetical protein